jgi:hypothetical protein
MKPNQSKGSRWRITILALCAAIFGAGMAFASPQKISGDMQAKTTVFQVDGIVQFAQMPTEVNHEKTVNRGGKSVGDLGHFMGTASSMRAAASADLALASAGGALPLLAGMGPNGDAILLDRDSSNHESNSISRSSTYIMRLRSLRWGTAWEKLKSILWGT